MSAGFKNEWARKIWPETFETVKSRSPQDFRMKLLKQELNRCANQIKLPREYN